MPRLRAWFCRLLGLVRKQRRETEMNAELQQHLDALTERNIAAGMSPKEARNAALREFGGVEQIKERAREQRVWLSADDFLQDLRFGARILRRSPGFAILAILCLTLGIGTNAAVFSWIEGILIRPYPLVAHQERMVALFGTRQGTTEKEGLSYPDFLDLQKTQLCSSRSLSIESRARRSASAIARNVLQVESFRRIISMRSVFARCLAAASGWKKARDATRIRSL